MEDGISKFVQKKVLYAGKGDIPAFDKGAKCTFHFSTKRVPTDATDPGVFIDNSKELNRPMELLIGKEFKLPIWEQCIKSMKVGEVSEFTIHRSLLDSYPLVSQSYRSFAGVGKPPRRRCCGLMAEDDYSTGNPQLDKWVKDEQDLVCTFELLKVQEQGEYEKDSWAMTAEERLDIVPSLKEQGNASFKQGDYKRAIDKYKEALDHVENLMLREKPGDEEWKDLNKLKIPLLLNYAQCKLYEGDYYEVIRQTTEVLKTDPDNTKALFRRAKAHFGCWSPDECRADLQRLPDLDPTLAGVVQKELRKLDAEIQKKAKEDSEKMMKMFK
ncbi:AH receptor-interacting protein-like [Ornithodoros turicata]|uniref:AH receptor-interacting protein-like n=1 Tax=Ornithodoros turicata TaxID=34597 RepID=UPI003139B0EE